MEEDQFRGQFSEGEQVSHQGVARLRELLGGAKVAMLTTMDEAGTLRSRPMVVQEITDEGDAWLITEESSPKVDELHHARAVNLTWTRPVRGRYISASGDATVVRDRERLKRLWTPTLQAWFPDGLDDPDLCLMRVHLETVDTWDAPLGNLVQVARLAGSILGRTPRPTHESSRQSILLRTRRPGIGDTAGIRGAAGGNLGVAPKRPREAAGPRVAGAAGSTMGEASLSREAARPRPEPRRTTGEPTPPPAKEAGRKREAAPRTRAATPREKKPVVPAVAVSEARPVDPAPKMPRGVAAPGAKGPITEEDAKKRGR